MIAEKELVRNELASIYARARELSGASMLIFFCVRDDVEGKDNVSTFVGFSIVHDDEFAKLY